MKIKILNKNLNHPEADTLDYSDVKVYKIDEAPVFTECYNETLDSGTVVISNQLEKIDISPYDIVELFYDDNTRWKYMCVDSYTETITCVNPKIYKYEISLFSETKQLEGIILPNLKITSIKGKAARSIWHYIRIYVNEYCPKIRIDNTFQTKFSFGNLQSKFNSIECPEMQWNTPTLREVLNDLMMVADCIPVIKDSVLGYLDLTKTTDTDWSDDITHINSISRSKSSEDYISELQVDLKNVTNKTGDTFVTKIEYVTLDIPDNDIVLTTNNMRLETQYPIYDLKSVKVMFPGGVRGQSPSTAIFQRGWVSADLMNINGVNLIYEEKEWITKNILYNTLYPENLADWPKYQNSTLYYTRGSNIISNFNNTTKFFLFTEAFYQKICKIICQQNWPSYDYDHGDYEGISPRYYNLLFKVEYETLQGCLFRASKGDYPEHERIVIDNQTNSYVDSYAQGFLEYQKANRLGNEQLFINARFDLPLPQNIELIKIADTYEDTVIYQCQYQFYSDHVEVNAYSTKNYILREYFTGVKSKIRSWQIASGNEALTRHDLVKFYCEFSYIDHEELSISDLDDNNVALYFISPLTTYSHDILKSSLVRMEADGNRFVPENFYTTDFRPQTSYYCLDLVSRVTGNSLVFSFGFTDNFWVGQSVHTTNDYGNDIPTHGTGENKELYVRKNDIVVNSDTDYPHIADASISGGGVPFHQYRYTDSYGEYTEIEAYFVTQTKIIPTYLTDNSTEVYEDDVEVGDSWYDSSNHRISDATQHYLYYIYQRPRVYQGNFKWNDVHSYDTSKIHVKLAQHKDSQEIINVSTQFEFCSETNDICFGKEWLNRQQAVNTSDNSTSNYMLKVYPSSSYDFKNINKLPDVTPLNYTVIFGYNQPLGNLNGRIFIALQGMTFNNPSDAHQFAINTAKNKCFYLVDENSNVLLAFNNIPEDNCYRAEISSGVWVPIYVLCMNILKSRNKNIYDENNHYLIVDKI